MWGSLHWGDSHVRFPLSGWFSRGVPFMTRAACFSNSFNLPDPLLGLKLPVAEVNCEVFLFPSYERNVWSLSAVREFRRLKINHL